LFEELLNQDTWHRYSQIKDVKVKKLARESLAGERRFFMYGPIQKVANHFFGGDTNRARFARELRLPEFFDLAPDKVEDMITVKEFFKVIW